MSAIVDGVAGSTDEGRTGAPERHPSVARPVIAGCLAATGLALLVTTWATRGGRPPRIEGLPEPGAVTTWALPAARALIDLGAVATVGLLALALLLPAPGDRLGPLARVLLRRAGQVAVGWTAAALVAVPLTVSEVTARPVADVVRDGLLREFAFSTGQTQALLSMAWLAAAVAFCAGATVRRPAAVALALQAVAASLPPAFTGHAAHGERHTLSVIGLGLHITALSLWCGTLLALVLHRRALGAGLPAAVRRFSGLALVCFGVVAVSGGLVAWSRLGEPASLWRTDYGRVLLVKAVLLAALGAVGLWHRRRTLPALAAGRSRAFLALATVEVVLMAATIGVAVGLSRTAPPPRAHALSAVVSVPVLPDVAETGASES